VSAPAPPPLAPPPSSPSPALWRVPAWIVQMAGTPCRRMTEQVTREEVGRVGPHVQLQSGLPLNKFGGATPHSFLLLTGGQNAHGRAGAVRRGPCLAGQPQRGAAARKSIESPTACPNGMTEARIPEAAATAGDLHPNCQGQPERQAGPQADMDRQPSAAARQAPPPHTTADVAASRGAPSRHECTVSAKPSA